MSAKLVENRKSGAKGVMKRSSPAPHPPAMGGKPVIIRDVKTVLTFNNREFHEKQLCDGIFLDLGDGCAYGGCFCDGESKMVNATAPLIRSYNHSAGTAFGFQDVVIRGKDAIELLKRQLLNRDGSRKFNDDLDNRVVFFPVTVGVAANMDLLRETAEACNLILNLTSWRIRILSRSHLLHNLIADRMILGHQQRITFGISIGTLNDRVAQTIEVGAPPVSKRLESLHWLQDAGLRTFGMIFPSLPQQNYRRFSREICEAIRVEKCVEVWAKVINYRSESPTNSIEALRLAKLNREADLLEEFTGPESLDKWEECARATYTAHAANIPPEKLRFLHTIEYGKDDWWLGQSDGVIRVEPTKMKARNVRLLPHLCCRTTIVDRASIKDTEYLEELEEIVTSGIKASIAAAQALFEIHSYNGGILWRSDFLTFEEYCRARWDYSKAHAYRLVDCGGFVKELTTQSQSPKGDSSTWMPVSETHVRPLLALPKEDRVKCWLEIVADNSPDTLTGKEVAKVAKQHLGDSGVKRMTPESSTVDTRKLAALAALHRLELSVQKLGSADAIKSLLRRVEGDVQFSVKVIEARRAG